MDLTYFRCGPDDEGKNIIIETSDITVKGLLEYYVEERTYAPWFKKWVTSQKKHKIYDKYLKDKKTGHEFFQVGIGWASYILITFKCIMTIDDYNSIVKSIYRDSYRNIPFPELKDIQNQDILHILKYRRALASLYTGYGKTQIIAVLAKYYHQDLGKRVLIVTPQNKPRDELIKRIKKLYNLKVSKDIHDGSGLHAIITNGLLNKSDIKDKTKEKDFIKDLESFDVVLVDEVEYTINPGGCYIYDHIKSEVLYGFSGTSDKISGRLINLRNGLSDPTVSSNATLIKYFGPALVFRQPLNLEVDDIRILTSSMNPENLKLWEIPEDSGNIYLDIMTRIFTNPEVCKTIVKIAEKFPLLFIPINNLQSIINNWIENWFLKKFRVLLVCHQGYLYYDLQGNITNLTLQEACDKIQAGEVDVIPSTSSGFRALDFPCLRNILIFSGKIAGSVLQSIGRIARQNHMNIISLDPLNGKKLPIHTNQQEIRKQLIEEYYRYCKINHINITEDDLPNYIDKI